MVQKMKYLILGSNGMAGHLICQYLIEKGETVEAISRVKSKVCCTYIFDISDFEKLHKIILDGQYDIIVNCIGLLQRDCDDNIYNAIKINALLPHFLVKVTKNMKTKIVHLSTDCVFSGHKGSYKENDVKDGLSNYAKTKALGEIDDNKNLTFRNSIIGPDIKENGTGLFHWFMGQDGNIDGYSKSLWNGVTTLTLAKAIHSAVKQNLSGVYQLTSPQMINKFELLNLFNLHRKNKIIINEVDGVCHDKSLVNTRQDFDFVIDDYENQINSMFGWINDHKELYPKYKGMVK